MTNRENVIELRMRDSKTDQIRPPDRLAALFITGPNHQPQEA